MRYPLALVWWEDFTSALEWNDLENAIAWEGFEFDHNCWAVGFIINDAEDHIVLAAQATKDFKQVAGLMRIPKSMIKETVRLVGAKL